MKTTKLPSKQERDASWLGELTSHQPVFAELLRESDAAQVEHGFFHTVREICQQPDTWEQTALEVSDRFADLRESLSGCNSVVLTGSGSSEYASDCLHPLLQDALRLPVQTVDSGSILLRERAALPPGPLCLISLARSGNGPESAGIVELMQDIAPEVRHLILTCNAKGQLAGLAAENPRLHRVVLDERTNDRSLVMTSSFTNMALAGLSLAYLHRWARYRGMVESLAAAARAMLLAHAGRLAGVARGNFRSAVFLGSGPGFGAARESALKVVEITAGRVRTFAETYLGLRHGPLASVLDDTLVVCFLSSDPLVRAYEQDLIRELNRKQLGFAKVIVGEGILPELLNEGDCAVECPGLAAAGDDAAPVLHVIAGQLIGMFRSLQEGLHPDSPSATGVISRVVESFQIHRRGSRDSE